MAKTRPPKIPERPLPVLPDDDVRRLPADCSGKDFRDRRDLAIIRPFLDTGMRLKGAAGLPYSPGDPEACDAPCPASPKESGSTLTVLTVAGAANGEQLRGESEDPLFVSFYSGSAAAVSPRMSTRGREGTPPGSH
jgi:integrase